MGSFSIWHRLVVLLVVLLLFGGGSKISSLMGDLAKGIKSFKKNMNEDEGRLHGGRCRSAGARHPSGRQHLRPDHGSQHPGTQLRT